MRREALQRHRCRLPGTEGSAPADVKRWSSQRRLLANCQSKGMTDTAEQLNLCLQHPARGPAVRFHSTRSVYSRQVAPCRPPWLGCRPAAGARNGHGRGACRYREAGGRRRAVCGLRGRCGGGGGAPPAGARLAGGPAHGLQVLCCGVGRELTASMLLCLSIAGSML